MRTLREVTLHRYARRLNLQCDRLVFIVEARQQEQIPTQHFRRYR